MQQPEEAAQEPAEGQQPQEEDAQEPAAAQSEEEEIRNGSGGDGEDEGQDAAVQAFMAAFQELRKWVDTSEAQYAVLHASYEAAQERPALAIK